MFNDADCTQPIGQRNQMNTYTALQCQTGVRNHWGRTLPEPSSDTYSVAYVYYRTPTGCDAGDWQDTSTVQYFKLNTCYQGSTGDNKYTGCTSTGGLTVDLYDTWNGSCSGSVVSRAADCYTWHSIIITMEAT